MRRSTFSVEVQDRGDVVRGAGVDEQQSSGFTAVYLGLLMMCHKESCCNNQFWMRQRNGSKFGQQRRRVIGGDELYF